MIAVVHDNILNFFKNFLLGGIISVSLLLGSLFGLELIPTFTANALTTEPVMAQSVILKKSNYKDNFLVAKGDDSLEQTTHVVYLIVDTGRKLLGAVAILMALISIIQLIVGSDKEEKMTTVKRTLLYSVIGLAIVALSSDLAQIFNLADGGLMGDKSNMQARVDIFDKNVRIIITFLKYVIGAVAILMLTLRGLNLITSGSNEEEVSKNKTSILYISLGLFILIFADSFIKNVLFKLDRGSGNLSIDLGQGIKELVGFTNFMVGWVGPIAVLTLVAGGLMYVVSFGNEDQQSKAKKMMITSIIGIIAIYGAFGIVTTVITRGM